MKENSSCTALVKQKTATTAGLQSMGWLIFTTKLKRDHTKVRSIGKSSTTSRCGSTIAKSVRMPQV